MLAVDRFGLSANNISYALLGNQYGLNFYKPFPAPEGSSNAQRKPGRDSFACDSAAPALRVSWRYTYLQPGQR